MLIQGSSGVSEKTRFFFKFVPSIHASKQSLLIVKSLVSQISPCLEHTPKLLTGHPKQEQVQQAGTDGRTDRQR